MPPKENQESLKLKEQGNIAFLNSQYEKAIELYTQALQIEENAIFYNNRSQAYFYQQDYERALADCDSALHLNPNYNKAIINKAQVLFEIGKVYDACCILQNMQDQSLESQALLRKFQEKSTHYIKKMCDEEELYREKILVDWLKSGKAYFPKIKLECYDKDYRGVHATRNINAKELIIFIPKSHMITLEMAKACEVSQKIIRHKLDLLSPKHSFLSVYLLQEKSAQHTFWKPYLDILPKEYSTFPIFYKNEELDWLSGSPVLKQVKDKQQDLHKDYIDICQVAPEFTQYSFNEFCWARMTASSRIFGITIKGVKTDALVPLADMLNHRRPKLTSWMYSDEKQGFIIETDEKFERGQMIFDSYGRKCNSRFLLNYGFVVDDNDANEVQIAVLVDLSDPLLNLKQELIRDCLQGTKLFKIGLETEETNVMEFMSYCRFLCITKQEELEYLNDMPSKSQYLFKPQKTPPISIDNEISMWQMIYQVVQKQLQQYPTTLTADQEILKTYELSTNQRNCLILRIGEKEILQFYNQMAEKMISLLFEQSRSKSAQNLNQFVLQTQNYKYMHYITRVINQLLEIGE